MEWYEETTKRHEFTFFELREHIKSTRHIKITEKILVYGWKVFLSNQDEKHSDIFDRVDPSKEDKLDTLKKLQSGSAPS